MRTRRVVPAVVAAGAATIVALAGPPAANAVTAVEDGWPAQGVTSLVSVNSTEQQKTGTAQTRPSMSRDGRFVAFATGSPLTADATPRWSEVYLRDRLAGRTRHVTVTRDGGPVNGGSLRPAVSASGRYVAFESYATNLVPGDTTGSSEDVFVRDVVAGATTRISVRPGGGETRGWSQRPSISDDGRYVAFESSAADLAAADPTTDYDVFVHDRVTGRTVLASVDLPDARVSGREAFISPDGRWVVFTALVYPPSAPLERRVFLRDLEQGRTLQVTNRDTPGSEGGEIAPVVSANGRFVAFSTSAPLAGDAGRFDDVFVWSRATKGYTRVSVARGGGGADGYSDEPSISDDGRFVAFRSNAGNLVAGGSTEYQVYLRDLANGMTALVSARPDGGPGNHGSESPDLSGDGRHIAFVSSADDLLRSPDRNIFADVFARDPLTGA